MSKNEAAVALGKLKRGIVEIPSELKLRAAKKNLILARKNRWKKNKVDTKALS